VGFRRGHAPQLRAVGKDGQFRSVDMARATAKRYQQPDNSAGKCDFAGSEHGLTYDANVILRHSRFRIEQKQDTSQDSSMSDWCFRT
jgi:hypothetical protein